MLNFLKLSFMFTLFIFAEAEIQANERTGQIEVVSASKNNGKVSTPESSLMDNKKIELKIRSDDNEGGKVNLIIEAMKDIQASERKIDRYSPAFNSEHGLLHNESPRDLKSDLKLNRNWDASRQEFSQFYPQQNSELFPFLMLRQVLQTPQPLILGQNQFSPIQNLRYFEEKLQREISPHVDRGINAMPLGVVMSQPIFTGISPNLIDQHRYRNPSQAINILQNLPIQQNSLHPALNFPQQAPQVHNLPFDRYPLVNSAPQKAYPLNNRNPLLYNALENNVQSPYQHYLDPQRTHQSLPKNNLFQKIPDILGPNKQPLPLNDRPSYTLDRNIQSISDSIPLQGRPYQQHQKPNHENIPKQIDHGTQNYHQNRESQLAHYKSILNEQPDHNSRRNRLQTPIHQHRTTTHSTVVPNNQRDLYINLRNVPSDDYNRVTPLQESPLRDYNLEAQRTSQLNQHPSPHQNINHQQLSSIDLKKPILQNRPDTNFHDDRKIPVYRSSPEGARPSVYQKHHASSEANYPDRHSRGNVQEQTQNSQPLRNPHQFYQEPSYGSLSRNTELGSTDSSDYSEDLRGTPEGIRTPTKKRKLRNRKRVQKDKIEDLEGHSSHQYIIKIG